MKVTEKDGIHFSEDNFSLVADSKRAEGDLNYISHAHFDHMHLNNSEIVCSNITAQLASERSGKDINGINSDKVDLHDAGHILGSTAALIKGEKDVLYTGDVSTRDRVYLDGFNPVSADVLVVESTYGIPSYTFPDQRVIENRIIDFIKDETRPLILFGYSLGKAQKILKLVEKAGTNRPLLTHGSVDKMNRVIEEVTDMSFGDKPYKSNKELMEENGILVAPSGSSQSDWVKKLVDKTGAVKAGFSGWAATDSFKYRGGYDKTFQLSDHCDFQDLVKLVQKVDPSEVYVQHGFDEEFASYLKREKGFNARALKKNQTSLTDF